LLKVSRKTIDNRVKAGMLLHTRVSRKLLFSRQKLHQWIALGGDLAGIIVGNEYIESGAGCPSARALRGTSASSRLKIGVADFGGYWETSGHKEVSHEQKVCCASVG
jgi:hypothetical protein